MEPFDYPQNNPGPHTLRVDAADLDDLHWLMERFTGYAGIMNFMGGRFTADEKALSPALADIAQRGLFFLDDGRRLIRRVAGAAIGVAGGARRRHSRRAGNATIPRGGAGPTGGGGAAKWRGHRFRQRQARHDRPAGALRPRRRTRARAIAGFRDPAPAGATAPAIGAGK